MPLADGRTTLEGRRRERERQTDAEKGGVVRGEWVCKGVEGEGGWNQRRKCRDGQKDGTDGMDGWRGAQGERSGRTADRGQSRQKARQSERTLRKGSTLVNVWLHVDEHARDACLHHRDLPKSSSGQQSTVLRLSLFLFQVCRILLAHFHKITSTPDPPVEGGIAFETVAKSIHITHLLHQYHLPSYVQIPELSFPKLH